MKRLRIGILDFLTNRSSETWFDSRIMNPNYAAIMPQCIAVWAEQLGHEVFYDSFTGNEDLESCLPRDLDVVFLSCFSRASFFAYAVSAMYRKRGAITVLGGPHARSFAQHARSHFDYICQLTDKDAIQSLLRNPERQTLAPVLTTKSQPRSLPGVEERVRFIDRNMEKNIGRAVVKTIPMIGSLGCPYTCHFCIDAPIPYKTLPYDEITADLKFVQKHYGRSAAIFWQDPNFGVRFKEYMGLIEESGTKLMHGGESSLSLLGEENLKQLKKANFVAMLPGIESWYGFNAKGATKKSMTPREKVRHVADHINLMQTYIPYVQANFVLGLDSDEGDEPFELTKEFVDRSPGVFPGYSMVTDFQNSPLSEQLAAEKRTLPVPYPLLDNNFAVNVRIKNYTMSEFYDRVIGLVDYTFSPRAIYNRVKDNAMIPVKIMNVGRSLTEGQGRLAHHKRIRKLLDTDRNFRGFFSGDYPNPPQYYFDVIRKELGPFAHYLAPELLTPEGFVASVKGMTPDARVIPEEKLAAQAAD